MRLEENLKQIIEPSLQALGLSLWGIEYCPAGAHSILRVYIEADGGVDMQTCARASRQIASLLDVEDPISGKYQLEVSSPGMDRRLFSPEQYGRYVGSTLIVKLKNAKDGRRKFKGQLSQQDQQGFVLECDGKALELLYADVDSAHIDSNLGEK